MTANHRNMWTLLILGKIFAVYVTNHKKVAGKKFHFSTTNDKKYYEILQFSAKQVHIYENNCKKSAEKKVHIPATIHEKHATLASFLQNNFIFMQPVQPNSITCFKSKISHEKAVNFADFQWRNRTLMQYSQ